MSEERDLNIYQKLAKIRKPVEILQKNKSGYGYKYVTEDLILAKITGLMDKLGVSLIPTIIRGTTVVEPLHYTKTKSTKDGKVYEEQVNEVIVHADMEWIWINNNRPDDRVVVPWTLVGSQSDASQSFGSGLSYSSRYFMLKYFNVATSDDDPDRWRAMQREAEDAENREISSKIIEKVHAIVVSHLEKNPDDKAVITSIVKKFAVEKNKPSANYYAITDPNVASRLLEEIVVRYGDSE